LVSEAVAVRCSGIGSPRPEQLLHGRRQLSARFGGEQGEPGCNMSDLLTRLTNQLDSLVPFLALAHKEVFEVVGEGYGDWLSDEQQSTLPESFQIFERQIAHGAFLVGYSYAEAFLGDLVRLIYLKNPQMLPRDKELKFSEVLDQDSYENVLAYMINKEVR